MNRIKAFIQDVATDQGGATVIEYGLVAGLISITIIVWATQIGQSVLAFFEAVSKGFLT